MINLPLSIKQKNDTVIIYNHKNRFNTSIFDTKGYILIRYIKLVLKYNSNMSYYYYYY